MEGPNPLKHVQKEVKSEVRAILPGAGVSRSNKQDEFFKNLHPERQLGEI